MLTTNKSFHCASDQSKWPTLARFCKSYSVQNSFLGNTESLQSLNIHYEVVASPVNIVCHYINVVQELEIKRKEGGKVIHPK